MAMKKVVVPGRWKGGRVRANRFGEPVWVIESRRDGTRYVLTLDVHSEREAEGELALFERDPVSYQSQARRAKVSSGAKVDDELLEAFRAAFEPTVSPKHFRDTMFYLERWKKALDGKDLARMLLSDYRALLKGLKPERHHITSLRSLTRWMRAEGRIQRSEDASLDLEVPQTTRARAGGSVAYPLEAIMAMYACLEDQSVRDVIALRVLTGLHHSEIERLAAGESRDGRWKVEALPDGGEIVGRVTFIHKNKGEHHQPLGQKAFDAAMRLQKAGKAPVDYLTVIPAVKTAALKAKLDRQIKMRPGKLRHSFIEAGLLEGREVAYKTKGVSLETMARAVGHHSISTTKIYSGAMAPMIVVGALGLSNEGDPDFIGPKRP